MLLFNLQYFTGFVSSLLIVTTQKANACSPWAPCCFCFWPVILTQFCLIHSIDYCLLYLLESQKFYIFIVIFNNVRSGRRRCKNNESLTILRGKTVLLNSVHEFIEIEVWLLLTFFLCLHNQLISIHSIFKY